MEAAGVNSDYVEYMMGHVVSTYRDIRSPGVETLRREYAKAELSIRPKAKPTMRDFFIEMVRAKGLDPDKVFAKEFLLEPEIKYLDQQERERREIRALSKALLESLKSELLAAEYSQNPS